MSTRDPEVAHGPDTCPTPALSRLIAAIQRRWGARALRRGAAVGGDPAPLPTSIAALDTLLNGGLPRGAITEYLGAPTSGMTTLALTALAHAQARGEPCAYIDAGGMFDAGYAAACGVALHDLLLARPTDVADALILLEALAGAGEFGMLVFDAPPTLPALAGVLRRLTPVLARTPTVLLALTILPALHPPAGHGSPLAHAAALRLHIARYSWNITTRGDAACMARVTVLKRRGAADGMSIDLPIIFPRDWDMP